MLKLNNIMDMLEVAKGYNYDVVEFHEQVDFRNKQQFQFLKKLEEQGGEVFLNTNINKAYLTFDLTDFVKNKFEKPVNKVIKDYLKYDNAGIYITCSENGVLFEFDLKPFSTQ